MSAQQPKGVLITFDELNQSFNICTVPRASVDDLMSRALVVPWALADSNFKLDDEVARSIGGLVFRLLATAQPGLTPLITVRDHPDAKNPPTSD
ncbi:hypothetical protein [Caballeronia sp.]|uniref:hypothetical protein n=1 Tax=Caballeronia sp. TaxID=1931223 RepID=UPI003C54F5A9